MTHTEIIVIITVLFLALVFYIDCSISSVIEHIDEKCNCKEEEIKDELT